MNIDIASIDMVSEVNMVSSEGGGCRPAGHGRPFPVPPLRTKSLLLGRAAADLSGAASADLSA